MTFPIHPEELDVAFLTKALNVSSGDILSVRTEFVGDAIGNTSDVYFIRLDVKHGSGLPQSLVAKMVPRFEGAVEVCKVLRLFQREIEIYREVTSRSPVRTPRLVWSDYDPDTSLGIMIMEDCSTFEGLDQTIPVPTTLEDLEKIVDSAADLHARWWDADDLRSTEAVLMPGDPVARSFAEIVTGGWESLLSGGPGSELIPESGRSIARLFTDSLVTLWHEPRLTDHLTIMHLDFRIDNLFFNRQENRPVIFDWQGTSVGRGAYDIAYLLATGYAPQFRREHEMDLLKRYHRRILAGGVTGYSFGDLEHDYVFGLVHSLWVVPFTTILDMSSERGQALANKIIGGIFTAIEDHNADAVFAAELGGQEGSGSGSATW